MLANKKRVFWIIFFMGALSLSVLFASSRKFPVIVSKTRGTGARTPIPAANATQDYVRISKLWPQLRWNLKALGDRLEKPGKERLTMTGTLTNRGVTQPVVLILEFPDHLRLETQGTGPHYIITFNVKAAGKVGGPIDQSDEDLIETLVYDGGDHFFSTQMRGQATRSLGGRFRLDDGSTPNYTGPFCDIYEVSDQINIQPQARTESKRYFFNSQTLLPDRVQYESDRNGSTVHVEIRVSDWQQVQGQQVARRVVRLENNQPVLTLVVTSVVMGPKADDGLFG